MHTRCMDLLTGLTEPWAYVAVGLMAAAESGAFLGLVLPGEAAMLLGGFLVFQGQAELPVMLACGVGGAVAGDSASYWIGRKAGPRLMSSRLGRRVGPERWERSRKFVRRRGGSAVLIGRFVGVLRALVPAIAGSAGVPYRTFLPYSVAGGALWVGTFIVLGSIAGGSWRIIEQWAGRATLVLVGVLVAIGIVWLAARWVVGHRETIQRLCQRFLANRRVASVRRRYERQISFLRRRLDPTSRFGLYLTVGVAVAIAAAWIFGEIIDALEERDDIYVIDAPVVRSIADHRSPTLTAVMRIVTHIGGSAVVALALAGATVIAIVHTRDRRWGAFFSAVVVGAIGLDNAVKAIVDRPRPEIGALVEVSGSAFPSGHTTAAAAMCAALAFAMTRSTTWRRAVIVWTVAFGIVSLVGLSRVYLGVHWPTDVLGGFVLGGGWVIVVATGVELLREVRDDKGPATVPLEVRKIDS
jgi:membrane protein DedA with SNARE-associated domain/membrane-associated phospholipid phosphatase